MRVVCISDTHGLHDALQTECAIPDGDVFIHAGDFTDTGDRDEVTYSSVSLSSGKRKPAARVIAFNTFLGKLPHKYKLVIAGNHESTFDPPFYRHYWTQYGHRQQYDPEEVRALLTHGLYLEDEAVVIEGVRFYGSPWQPEFCNWAFNLPRGEALRSKWAQIPTDTDVLITHTPPHGHGDWVAGARNVGDEDLLLEVQTRIKPRFHIFGHVHEGYGRSSDGVTTFFNASSCTHEYEARNPAFVFDIECALGAAKATEDVALSYAVMLHERLRRCAQKIPFKDRQPAACNLREFRVDGTTADLLFESTLKMRPVDGLSRRALRYLFHPGNGAGSHGRELVRSIQQAAADVQASRESSKLPGKEDESSKPSIRRRSLERRVTVAVINDAPDISLQSESKGQSDLPNPRARRRKTLERRQAVALLPPTKEETAIEAAEEVTTVLVTSESKTEVGVSPSLASTEETTTPVACENSIIAVAEPECVLCKYNVPGHQHPGKITVATPPPPPSSLAIVAPEVECALCKYKVSGHQHPGKPATVEESEVSSTNDGTQETKEAKKSGIPRVISANRLSSWF